MNYLQTNVLHYFIRLLYMLHLCNNLFYNRSNYLSSSKGNERECQMINMNLLFYIFFYTLEGLPLKNKLLYLLIQLFLTLINSQYTVDNIFIIMFYHYFELFLSFINYKS